MILWMVNTIECNHRNIGISFKGETKDELAGGIFVLREKLLKLTLIKILLILVEQEEMDKTL